MSLFLQRLLDGLASGATYAALGLAIVLVFRSTRVLNLAQGELALLSAYVAWWLAASPGGPGFALPLAIVLAVAFSFLVGATVERVLVRPVERSSNALLPVVVVMAVFVAVGSLVGWLFGTDVQQMPSLFPAGTVEVLGVVISWDTLGLLGVLVVLCIALWFLLQRTKVGLAMRAVASNPESASLAGVPVGRLLMFGWGLAASVGAVAGILVAPRLFLSTTMMHGVLLYAFVAVAIGGFDSFVGAITGGLVVGVLESFVGGYLTFIGSDLKLTFALVVLIGFLLLRPSGIFGTRTVERA